MNKKPLTIDEMAGRINEKTNGTLTPTEAKAILQQEAQTRVEACQAEIGKVLDKYQCTIDVAVILRQGQVIPQVQIVAK